MDEIHEPNNDSGNHNLNAPESIEAQVNLMRKLLKAQAKSKSAKYSKMVREFLESFPENQDSDDEDNQIQASN